MRLAIVAGLFIPTGMATPPLFISVGRERSDIMVAATAKRINVVFIRKSTTAQDERAQKSNVRGMLKELGVTVPDQYWFVCTVPRSKVSGNEDFKRLLELVEADRVRTVYIESQDRWGTGSVAELFTLLRLLANHGTALYDLRERTDLTSDDDHTEIKAFLGGLKSKKERKDLAYRAMRTKVNNFMESGSWPAGVHPFGYGKACYTSDGKLLWEWHPTTRLREVEYIDDDGMKKQRSSRLDTGDQFFADAKGKLTPGPKGIRLPRKDKGQIIKLVPSRDKKAIKAVRLIFELFTRAGLSRRQISARLVQGGHKFYDREFTHSYVTQILNNPAYAGDTHFGKRQTADFHSFDRTGKIIEYRKNGKPKDRSVEDRIIVKGTHEPLIDAKTWKLAQAKLAIERERVSYAPSNPDYYLKQIFVCGHCGKNMSGRTEIDPSTKKRTVIYVCNSYVSGKCNGHKSTCGYHRITHADAEKLLLDKIKELNLQFDELTSAGIRKSMQKHLAQLWDADEESRQQWWDWLTQGVDSLVKYMRGTFGVKGKELQRLEKAAMQFYRWGGKVPRKSLEGVSVALSEFKKAIKDAERLEVEESTTKLSELKERHKELTLKWARASEDREAVLALECDRMEEQMRRLKARVIPLSERLNGLYEAESSRQLERDTLFKEWPKLENREKGEALHRLFTKVSLFWEATFHARSDAPTRPHRTNRPGRFSYKLLPEKFVWEFKGSNLGGPW